MWKGGKYFNEVRLTEVAEETEQEKKMGLITLSTSVDLNRKDNYESKVLRIRI